MIISTIQASNCTPQTIVIGRRGTYDTMQIAFDLSYLIENYGSGTAVLAIKRSQDESAYPAVVTQEDATLLWTVNETDTAYVGSGECQLMWYVDGGLVKTIIYPMVVMRDILSTAETPPDGYENWIEHLTDLGVETLRNAQNAAQSASDAEIAKDDAVTAKEASKAAKEKAEEAQEKAEIAVSHYPVIINGYWNVWSVEAQTYVSTGIKAEGEDGYSPEVTITSITGGHRVTITDEDHPQGQSFDVLDGQSGTTDYTDLDNKPSINGHTLDGDQTAEQLGLATPSDIPNDAGDIGYDDTETYESGTVGGGLNDLSRQLSDLEDTVSTTQIINTASGAIASFDDGADNMPIRKLAANIEPVQDLHGYDSPWPAGGWKNLASLENPELTTNTSQVVATFNAMNGTYDLVVSFDLTNADCQVENAALFNLVTEGGTNNYVLPTSLRSVSDNTYWSSITKPTTGRFYATWSGITAPTLLRVYFESASYGKWSGSMSNVQLEIGTSPTAFSPFSNICPISGHTGAEIQQTGKNLYHCDNFTRSINAISVTCEDDVFTVTGSGSGQITIPGQFIARDNVVVSTDKTFTINQNNIRLYGARRMASGSTDYPTFSERSWQIDAGGGINALYIQTTADFVGPFTFGIQIELGSATATDYVPYTGSQISVNWEDEAGTVYGGTLDVTNGVLTVDRAIVDLGTLTYTYTDAYKIFITSVSGVKNIGDSNVPAMISSMYKGVSWYVGATDATKDGIMCILPAYNQLRLRNLGYTDPTAFKTAMSGQAIVYELATPITYQLTPQEISTLLGTNNVWADTGDIAECEYPADTKLYIDGKIADAIAALQS